MAEAKSKAKKKVELGPAPKVPPTTSLTGGMTPPTAGQTHRQAGQPYKMSRRLPGGPLPPGRPARVGQYVISPNPDYPSGFEMLNDQPELIDKVHDDFLKNFRLPPSLTPSRLRPGVGEPEVMKAQRGKKISRGFVYQKSLRA
jgi:hypothetical protein